MNTMTDIAGKAWSWAFCRAIRARQRAEALLREESAQGTTEYAIWSACRSDPRLSPSSRLRAKSKNYGTRSKTASTACRRQAACWFAAGARLFARGNSGDALGAGCCATAASRRYCRFGIGLGGRCHKRKARKIRAVRMPPSRPDLFAGTRRASGQCDGAVYRQRDCGSARMVRGPADDPRSSRLGCAPTARCLRPNSP